MHYHERLQNLLVRSDVIAVLQRNHSSGLSSSFEVKKKTVAQRQRAKLNNLSLQMAPSILGKKDADEVISKFIDQSMDTTNRLRESLKSQEDISKRIEARRRASSQQPKLKDSQLEQCQNEIEKVLEKYVKEKLKRTKLMKRRYSEEAAEVKKMGGGELLAAVLQQMDQELECELAKMTAQLNEERKKELSVIKTKWA